MIFQNEIVCGVHFQFGGSVFCLGWSEIFTPEHYWSQLSNILALGEEYLILLRRWHVYQVRIPFRNWVVLELWIQEGPV